jgi:hypothetical protein
MQSLTHDQIKAIRSALQSNDVDEIHKRVLSNMLNEHSGKDSSSVLYVDGAPFQGNFRTESVETLDNNSYNERKKYSGRRIEQNGNAAGSTL